MKRFAFAVAAMAVLVAGCIVCTIVISRCAARMEEYLSRAELYAANNDLKGAFTEAKAAASWWEDWAPILDAVRQHSETDQIGFDLGKLLVYAESGNREEFSAICAELLRQVQHIREMEYPLLQNIL